MAHVLRVTSVTPPTIRWRCPRCPCDEFVCSDLFRMNTHGKVADIWLIYRCARCDATKNISVVERTPVSKIASAVIEAALANDVPTARRLARDVGLLRRNGAAVKRGDAYTIEGVCPPDVDQLELAFDEPLLVRVDHVVASALGTSRRALRRAMDGGVVAVSAEQPSRLRLTSGVEVALLRERSRTR